MASLQKHRSGGHTYWRIVESQRVNGKPRAIPILHLGTADALLDRLLNAPAGQLRLRSYQHGDVAALKAAADRLGVVDIIDRHFPRQRRKPSVGTTLVLAAINRALCPRSKRGWAQWAQGTSLHRLFPGLKPEDLTSQVFWDQMDRVTLEMLPIMEGDLAKNLVSELDIELDTLLYDTTNFFTYIASTNQRPKLPQRGRSKQKRADLRIFSLALLVSRDGQIPLCSHVYEGNRVDSKVFPESLARVRERLVALSGDVENLTVVYDKGNLSKVNQAVVDGEPFGYVASLVGAHHRELIDIPTATYDALADGPLKGTRVLRLTRKIWGVERTVVLTISEQLREGQLRGLHQHLNKRLQQLAEWKDTLAQRGTGPRNAKSAQEQIAALLSGQHMKKVLKVEYRMDRRGSDRLHYEVDEDALAQLATEEFGKMILVTDRGEWTNEEILQAYRGQNRVESTFRQLKDVEHLAVRPQYHWTDQKIHVHTFICIVGLMLARMVEREARRLGARESLSAILDALGQVRLALVLRASGKKGGRPSSAWQLEEGEPEAMTLFEHLVPAKAPFVYTAGSTNGR